LAHKVLLADDSVTAQNMGRRILVDAGYEVITVNNGSSALKKITETKPDLIVLDVYMPGYGGLEVCQRIRETPETARIPVLLTVGKLEPFKGDEARRVRADAFIVKPFEASELLAALTHLEDKIVAQPSAPKRSPQLKADPTPEPSNDFGDKDRGWKSRLRIPAVRGRTRDDADSDSATPPAEFYEVKLRSSESAQPPAEIAALVPTPVEQEALNRTPEPQDGQRPAAEPAAEPKPSQQATAEERTIAKDLEATPATLKTETAPHPEPAMAISIAPAAEDRPQGKRSLGEEEVAAALATLAPNNAKSGAPGTTDPRPQAVGSEPALATMAATGTRPQLGSTRWIAEPVALANDESSLILEHEMQKALAAPAAAASLVSHAQIPSLAIESLIPQGTKLLPPEKPVSVDTKEARGEAAVSALSSPAEGRAASLPESSDPQEKELQAYAAQASAGASTQAVASPQPSPTTDPPAVVAQSKEDSAVAAVERLLAEAVVPPALTAKIVEVAQSSFSKLSPQEPGTQSAAEAGAGDSDTIARIVDGVLSELKPKLIEEIVKKMKKDGK